ncbi:MAG: flavin reductase family protein [Candidatus Omnitrophica bacterium]|nr:flavin reductase family protein [Candidatus Omnitrophota bacterium]MCM8815906.1 flavin reductase family protein [Candidatus Omnitrophota bacterium]
MAKKYIESGLTNLVRARPIIIIVTLHPDGTINAGTFGAYTNVSGSEIGIAIGKPSHTYRNIKRTGEFTINVVNKAIAKAAEICGRDIPENQSELEIANLHCENSRKISVPIIKECIANIECRYKKEVEINYHSFIIAKCVAGHIEEKFIASDGGLDVVKSQVIFNIGYPEPLYATLENPFLVR